MKDSENRSSAVFLDRDGVIIEDVHLLTSCEQVRLFDGVAESLERLCQIGYLLFIVSNQTVVARGLSSEEDVTDVNAFICSELSSTANCKIEKCYFCPHHPEATVQEYRVKCNCRKPLPGLLLRAAEEYGIDLKSSFMVGDRISDVIAGCRAGCRTIHVQTGMHSAAPIVSDAMDLSVKPDHVCMNINEAVEIILEKD